jgi:trehalose synthase
MSAFGQVDVGALSLDPLVELLDPASQQRIRVVQERARGVFDDRTVWHVNSTSRGGGVAEMLHPLLAYARGAGIDARWLVIGGEAPFFAVTKRIHNRLHGSAGDGGPLGDAERAVYEGALAAAASELAARAEGDDIVVLHDPQTAGLVPALKARGLPVVWRCHVGVDHPDDLARSAWDFLRPYVSAADAVVFSRAEFAWEGLDPARLALIAPSIDGLSPKNQDLAPETVAAVLAAAGLREGDGGAPATFRRLDGREAVVERRAVVDRERPLRPGEPVVLQVSRWDRLKDPLGVIRGFAEHVPASTGAHLVYAGPAVEAVSDDPEGAEVLAEARAARAALAPETRERVHLALLPMDDADENAVIVNALQRDATVVVQKSLAEGFGLTVAEAMWKGRPVVASRIGGIQDQIEDGRSGLLLDDPADLAGYGALVTSLLEDPARAEAIGTAARERVRGQYLGTRSLLDYAALLERVLEANGKG